METEFKFRIPPERLKAVEAALRRGAVQRTRLQARYFDTPEGALAARHIVLRLRKEGRRWVQTVKAAGDGPLQRLEHNVDLGVARVGQPPSPDVLRHAGTAVGELLVAALADAGTPPLVESYATDVWRLTRDVRAGGAVVELALDLGRITAQVGSAEAPETRTAPVCELELELKRGDVRGLVALAQRWSQQHGLWFSTVSKAECGARLLAGRDRVPAVKAAPPRAFAATPDGRTVQRAVVANALAQILPNASEIAAGDADEEQIHQLRIGVRRLRTALRELSALDPLAFDAAWQAPLADAFRALGEQRDRSQCLQLLQPRLEAVGAPPITLPPGPADGVSAADVVRAPAFQSVLVALIGFAADPAAGQGAPLDAPAVLRHLRARLQRLHRHGVDDAAQFETLASELQHGARKRLKRLRYLAEFVAPLFAQNKKAARYLKRLGPAQDALGLFNDEAVALGLYREASAQDPHAWFAVGWLVARQPAGAAASGKALGQIAKGPRFWKKR